MTIVRVFGTMTPEQEALFLAAVRDVVAATRQEPACIHYSCYRDAMEPHRFVFYEEWESMDGLREHLAKSHVAAFFQVVQELGVQSEGIDTFETPGPVRYS